jgi:predicted transcriptional regulator
VKLAQIATRAGTNPERLVTDVVARYLDEEARFLAAVETGIAAAERGEFIEEEEMDARLESMFKAGCAFVGLSLPPTIWKHQGLPSTELSELCGINAAGDLSTGPFFQKRA